MKKLLFVLVLTSLSALAQTSLNFSGGSAVCNSGSVEVGENSTGCVYAITNNTGSDVTVLTTPFVAQAYPFVWDATVSYGQNYTVLYGGHTYESLVDSNVGVTPGTDGTKWADRGTAKYVTVAADGDARWRTWGEPFNPNAPSASNFSPATWTFPNGSTANLTCYAAPHAVGAVTGHCYLVNAAGTIQATVTVNATGVAAPISGGATLPTGCVYNNGSYDCSGVMDTTYPAPTSCTTTVSTGSALATALASASCGSTICVTKGATLTGNFTIPKINSCSFRTQLITSGYASLPAQGNRVGPSDAANMAKIQESSGLPVFTFADGSNMWIVRGLEITSTAPAAFLVSATSHSTMYLAANMPSNNLLAQIYMHTSGTTGGFGINMAGSFAVLDSYLDLEGTNETQGINTCTSNGPIVVRNNYVKAVGENILFGGCDSGVLGAVPQDVVFQHNYLYKPLTWDNWCTGSGNPCAPIVYDGTFRQVKNLFELKKSVRVLVDSNIAQNNWIEAQDGSAILMEPANQSGSDLAVSVRDITFTNNIVHDAWNAFNHVSSSYAWPSRTSKHWTVRNNLFYNIGDSKYGIGTSSCIANWSAGASSWFFRWQSNPTPDTDVWIQHNTCLGDNLVEFMGQNVSTSGSSSSSGIQVVGWNLKNNLLTHGFYGIIINGTVGTANAGLAWTNYDLAKNLFIGSNPGTYSADFQFVASNASVGFADYVNHDYRLCTGAGQPVAGCTTASPFLNAATDGAQMGANVAFINTQTSCVISGLCAPTQSFTISPTSATVATGGQVQFVASDPFATYTTSAGSITSSGLLTAPSSPATVTVTATQPSSGLTAVATVTVIANSVSPSSVSLPVGGSQQFAYPISATWSVTAGTVSPSSGVGTTFTAPGSAQTVTIKATSGSLSATATASVVALTVSPTNVPQLQVGGTQQFSANFPVTWSATGGTISSSGLYTAPQVNGTYTITARAINGGTTATATVTVIGQPTFIALTVNPTSWTTAAVLSTPVTQSFTFTNPGTGSVTPTITISGSTTFSITANTCNVSVAGGGTCSVTAQFISSAVGSYFGSISETDTAGGALTIQLQANIPTAGVFTVSPTTATVQVGGQVQLTASAPAQFSTDTGTVTPDTGLFTAPASPAVSTVTATQLTVQAQNLNTSSLWKNCGNCGNTGGPNGSTGHGTFTFTAGDPATLSIQPAYGFDNFFWWYVLGSPGQFNTVNDYVLSFDVQFPKQSDKNASQAIEFELQKNVLDHQYSMAWQICFACGNKLRVFNKTTHVWEDTGLTFNPTIFAGGKWVRIWTSYHLDTGVRTRHIAIALNGDLHVVNIDHAPTPAVESDYLHPAYQMDSNSKGTPYTTLIRNFNVYTPSANTAQSIITSVGPTLSPATVTLPVLGIQQFSNNGASSGSWSATSGSITQTGFFTAPNSPATVTISFTPTGLTAMTATANIKAFTVTPSSVTLQKNSTQQFAASFPATWSVTAGTCTITSTGMMTAASSAGSCTVRATANNGGATATSAVTVVDPPAPSNGKRLRGGKSKAKVMR